MSILRWLRRCVTSRGFRIALGVGLMALLFSQVDLRSMVTVIAGIRLDFLTLLIAVMVALRLIGALRWYVLLRNLQGRISYLQIIRLTFVSDFMGYFAPGSVGVDAIRLYGMSRMTSDMAFSATSMLVERIVAFLALILLGLVGLSFELPGTPQEIAPLAWLALALLAVALVALMAPPVRSATLLVLSSLGLSRVHGAARKIYSRLDQYRSQPWRLAVAFLISLIFQLLRCTAVWVGAMAFGVFLPFTVFIVIMPVIILVTLLPISIAGLGVRELGFVVLFGQVGMPAEVALSLSLLMRLLTILLATPGAWLYARRGIVA